MPWGSRRRRAVRWHRRRSHFSHTQTAYEGVLPSRPVTLANGVHPAGMGTGWGRRLCARTTVTGTAVPSKSSGRAHAPPVVTRGGWYRELLQKVWGPDTRPRPTTYASTWPNFAANSKQTRPSRNTCSPNRALDTASSLNTDPSCTPLGERTTRNLPGAQRVVPEAIRSSPVARHRYVPRNPDVPCTAGEGPLYWGQEDHLEASARECGVTRPRAFSSGPGVRGPAPRGLLRRHAGRRRLPTGPLPMCTPARPRD
jgi:hypothetical protein